MHRTPDLQALRALPVRMIRDGVVPRAECPHCAGEIALSAAGSRWVVRHPADVAERLIVQLGGLKREELHVLLLNTRNVVIAQERVYQGNVSAALVRVGELFQAAVKSNVASILICHNHPSGDPTPSPDDLFLTAEAISAGRLLDIPVLDHLIIGGASFISLRDSGVEFDAERGASKRAGDAHQPGTRRCRAALRLEGDTTSVQRSAYRDGFRHGEPKRVDWHMLLRERSAGTLGQGDPQAR